MKCFVNKMIMIGLILFIVFRVWADNGDELETGNVSASIKEEHFEANSNSDVTCQNFISEAREINKEDISAEEKVERIDDEMREVADLDKDMSFKKIKRKDVPKNVEIIETSTPEQYADVLASILEDNDTVDINGNDGMINVANKAVTEKYMLYICGANLF